MKGKKKISVLIPDGESSLSLLVVRCLRQEPGINVSIISKNPNSPIRFSRLIKSYNYNKIENEETELSNLRKIIKLREIDIVLPIDQHSIGLISRNKKMIEKDALIAPIPLEKSFLITSDKWLFAEFLMANRIPHPYSVNIENEQKLERAATLNYPILLKPKIGFNGHGIIKVNNFQELKSIYETENNLERFILQKIVTGYDIDCSVLSKNGEILAFTIQRGLIKGRWNYGPASGIEFIYNKKVFDIVKDLIRKLNWTGVAHIDLKYDEHDDTFKILELNPRYWGSLLGSLNAGINFPYLACLSSIGEKIPLNEYQFKNYIAPQDLLVLLKSRMENRNRKQQKKYNTGFKYILNDPLPEIVGTIQGYFG